MSKQPKIDHEYHAGKDKMKITIQGYSPSKKSRDAILKKLMEQFESSPDRLVADAKKDSKRHSAKSHAANKGCPSWSRLVTEGEREMTEDSAGVSNIDQQVLSSEEHAVLITAANGIYR